MINREKMFQKIAVLHDISDMTDMVSWSIDLLFGTFHYGMGFHEPGYKYSCSKWEKYLRTSVMPLIVILCHDQVKSCVQHLGLQLNET